MGIKWHRLLPAFVLAVSLSIGVGERATADNCHRTATLDLPDLCDQVGQVTRKLLAAETPEQTSQREKLARETLCEKVKYTLYCNYHFSKEETPAQLNDLENRSIRFYTGAGYLEINTALRAKRQDFDPLVETIHRGLEKLPKYQGIVRRGALLPQERLQEHQVGQIVQYDAFTSTSKGHGFSDVHRFVIHSKTGADLDSTKINSAEQEVLFPPGTKFKVLDRRKVDDQIEFTLEEVE